MEENSPFDTTVLLPETGPWKQGASNLIVGALHILWFHVPFNRINNFYQVLQQAKEATGQGHQMLAEEKWILAGFTLVSVFFIMLNNSKQPYSLSFPSPSTVGHCILYSTTS